MTRSAFTAGLYLAASLLTLADALTGSDALRLAAAACMVGFVALELPQVQWAQRLAGGALLLGGLAAGWQHGTLAAVALDGASRALPFLVLFAAVMTLQVPALASPAFRTLGEAVVRQPPGRRYAMLALAGHGLGAVLNLAGLQLVASLIDPETEAPLRRRLTLAVMRGFSAAVCWSPFFVGMAVVLTVLPQTSWLQVAPVGALAAAALLATAWSADRLARPRPTATAPRPSAPKVGAAVWLRVAGVFLALGVPVVGLGEGVDLGIAIAIGLVAPSLAFIWQARLPRRAGAAGAAGLARTVASRLPGLRNEAVLFLGATVFGTGMAALVGDAAPAAAAPVAGLAAPIKVVALTLAGTALAGLGIHPVVLVIVVGQILPPAALGLPAATVALILVVAWGMGTAMSPFSATAMQVARLLSVSPFRVAWAWNARYCLPAAGLAALLIAAAERAGLAG